MTPSAFSIRASMASSPTAWSASASTEPARRSWTPFGLPRVTKCGAPWRRPTRSSSGADPVSLFCLALGVRNHSVPGAGNYRQASSAMIYVQEELSDARLRCDELKNMMTRVLTVIDKSSARDKVYAVAGDIVHAAPDCLLKLEKALDAAAMAVNKMDYEDLRQTLRPEKVDELERVLDEVRLRLPRRTGIRPGNGRGR